MLKEKLGHHPVTDPGPDGRRVGVPRGSSTRSSARRSSSTAQDGETIREEEVPAEYAKATAAAREKIIHDVADVDDVLAEKFINEEPISVDDLRAAIRRATLALKMTPVMCGSAIKNKGVQLLLDGVVHYLPHPTEVLNEAHDQTKGEEKVVVESDPTKPFVGLAFKLQQDKYGQLTYFRVYQGTVSAGDTIYNASNEMRKVRVPRMFRMHSEDREEIPSAEAGDIVAFYGVEASSGETFTDGKVNWTLTSMHVPAAVISLAVAPKDRATEVNFSKALNRFTKEDPTFRVHQDEESQQTIISGMGELHLDIYMERMRREYNCDVIAGKPQVAYRESITRRAEINYTHKKQTGGSGQYAKIMGYIEPLPADAVESYEFLDDVTGGSIPREFISSCDKGFKEAVRKGTMIGFPIVGVRCAVNDGASHAVDSSEMAFKTAAMMGFREAYANAKPTILEPIMKVEIDVPTEFQGSVVGQVNQRRGVILETIGGDTVTRHLRGAAQRHVRLLDRSALRDAGQGHVHHGVRPVRHRPEARAGRDEEEVPREARRRGRAEVAARAARARQASGIVSSRRSRFAVHLSGWCNRARWGSIPPPTCPPKPTPRPAPPPPSAPSRSNVASRAPTTSRSRSSTAGSVTPICIR